MNNTTAHAPTEQLRPTVTAQAAARQFAGELGWQCFPVHGIGDDGRCTCGKPDCGSQGKHPACKSWKQDATNDPEKLADLWGRRSGLNLGVVCGEASGVVVLDIDPRNGGDDSLEKMLAEFGPLPTTAKVLTGGGGEHYYFRHPGWLVRCRPDLRPGVDLKADGGYVVGPPSSHKSGGVYRFAPGLAPQQVGIADAPEWLLRLVADKKNSVEPIPPSNGKSRDPAGAIPNGQRNATLASDAGAMRRRGFGREAIAAALHVRNQSECSPPLDDEEVEQIAASVSTYPPAAEEELQLGPAVGKGLTDAGNAERFAAKFGDRVRYVHEFHEFRFWNGKRWAPNSTGEVMRLAKQGARGIYAEASQAADDNEAKAIVAHARASQSRTRLEAMLALAQSELPIATKHETFDSAPYLLGADNGTIDLRTGELREHRPDDFLTLTTHIEYPAEPGIEAPRWLTFLEEIFAGNDDLIRFVQRLLGQSLIGEQLEHILPIFWGAGLNGKSVLLNVVLHVLGDYGLMGAQGLLMASRNERHPTDLCDLHLRRLVVLQETNDGQHFNEGLLKSVTGGDRIRARRMRENFWEFTPSHTAVLVSNHKPRVRGDDMGVWRRLRLVPFTVQIPPERQDRNLTEKLKAESPAILKWLVEGCLAWQREGLNEPAVVLEATEEYRSDCDNLTRWLGEETIEQSDAYAKAGDLRNDYEKWCSDNGETAVNRNRFGVYLAAKYHKIRRRDGWYYVGIGLLAEGVCTP